MAKPTELNAKEKNHLSTRANDFIKKINDCMQTKSANEIKHFWQDHADAMQALLHKLEKAQMKKEYVTLDRAMHQTLYKAVLINKSKRLARDMVGAFAKNNIDTVIIKKFEMRGMKIEEEMKRMGFEREAKMHASLFRLHLKEDKKEIAYRVSKKGFFENSQTEDNKPREPILEGDETKHKP